MSDFESEIKQVFLQEAEGLLADVEQSLMTLEGAGVDDALVDKIFRLAHSLKGSAGAVGFMDLAHVTHHFETLLLAVKKKSIALVPSVTTLMLECVDEISSLVAELRDDVTARRDCAALVARMEACIRGSGEDASGHAPSHTTAPAGASIGAVAPAPIAVAAAAESWSPMIIGADTDLSAWDPGGVAGPMPVPSSPAVAATHVMPAIAKDAVKDTAKDPGKETPKPAAEEVLRVQLSKVDKLLNNIGEIVVLQTVLHQHKHAIPSPFLQKTISQLTKIVKEVQDISLGLRMVSLKQTFQKLQRIVRDVSTKLGKEVHLRFEGEDTEVDKTVLDRLSDPLVHMVRNAVDHGVEDPDTRERVGKPRHGTVTLRAFHRGDRVVIEVGDDGKGLSAAKLTAKAKEKGLVAADASLTPEQAHALIFMAGFSTKSEVTDISGRGVGMDVVRSNIQDLDGTVSIETREGHGTIMRVSLPLTLGIIDGLVLASGSERYVVPVSQIVESLQPLAEQVSTMGGNRELLSLRGQTLPVAHLGELLGRARSAKPTHESIAVLVRDQKNRTSAVIVDDIVTQQQVVIKPLGGELKGASGLAGGAILGDGRPALILDLVDLLERHARVGEAMGLPGGAIAPGAMIRTTSTAPEAA